jgi:hypothetical protein
MACHFDPKKFTPLERLMMQCSKRDDGCWEWTGSRDRKGYGHCMLRGYKTNAHRVSWIVRNGQIPPGLFVLHKCDNPPCINPDHLFLGDVLANAKDMTSKSRQARGRDQHSATLDECRVREILGRTEIARVVAAEFVVCRGVISDIRNGRTWNHVSGLPHRRRL